MNTSLVHDPMVLAIASAEAFFVVTRAEAILIGAKRADQRTAEEQSRVARGLTRSLLLEAFVFVPTSCLLVLLLTPLIPNIDAEGARRDGIYALLGLVSYGFPFATARALVVRAALRTLNNFQAIATDAAKRELQATMAKQDSRP